MLQQVVPRQENYTESRATALQNVESTISELSGVFTHLSTMVAHQGELAIRLDILAFNMTVFVVQSFICHELVFVSSYHWMMQFN